MVEFGIVVHSPGTRILDAHGGSSIMLFVLFKKRGMLSYPHLQSLWIGGEPSDFYGTPACAAFCIVRSLCRTAHGYYTCILSIGVMIKGRRAELSSQLGPMNELDFHSRREPSSRYLSTHVAPKRERVRSPHIDHISFRRRTYSDG